MADAAVLARYVATYEALQNRTAQAVLTAWLALGEWNEAQVAEFVATITPIVSGAQAATATAVDAQVATLTAARPIGIPAAVVDDLRGVDLLEQYRRPFIRVWKDLGDQVPWETAVKKGGQLASSMARTDVALAQRASMEYLTLERKDVTGYRRLLNGGACIFCAAASTRVYTGRIRSLELHTGCKCGVAPVLGDRDPAVAANDAFLQRLKQRGPDYWKQQGFVDEAGDPIDPTDLRALRKFDDVERNAQLGAVLALT